MTLSRFSVFDLSIKLCKFESKSACPIYAIKYARGFRNHETYIYNSISYTREQAFAIYRRLSLYLFYRYIYLHKFVPIYLNDITPNQSLAIIRTINMPYLF